MVSIAPSMLGADFGSMRKAAELVAPHSSYLHMDVMDGHFVPNLTMGVDLVKALKGIAPLDVHLMVTDPLNFIDDFYEAGAEIISVHIEAKNPKDALKKINDKGIKSGIALNPSTPKEKIIPLLDIADIVLVMSVEPGYCGQSFHKNAIDRVNFFKSNFPEKIVEVDGGVNTENSAVLTANGADILVAGSAIFNSKNPIKTIKMMMKS